MVFAAGLGTRLKPLTDTMPKALVPVYGQPLIYHVLSKLCAAGYDDITVNVHHFAEQIKDYLASHDFGADIHISDESAQLLETGGGIKHARPFLEGEPFLVHNVDIISNLDLEWFRSLVRPGALSTLLVSERSTQRYLLFDDDMRLCGWTNLASGETISPYPELCVEECRKYAFGGIHIMSPEIFGVFDEFDCPERFSIIELYLKACLRYNIYGVVCKDLSLVDVGKFDSLPEAERICSTLLR